MTTDRGGPANPKHYYVKNTAKTTRAVGIASAFERSAFVAAILLAAYFIGAFSYVAVSRMAYPFALEWLEGGSYAQVQRILTGLPLYARPSMEYVAMIYPPVYYYAAAVLSRILGLGFLPLRLVSFGAAWGVLCLIYLIVKQHGASSYAGLLGSGLFAATYRLSGSWFDIARVDMLSVFLMLLAIWLLAFDSSRLHVAAALAYALACFTKQTHLITLVFLTLYFAIWDRRRLWTFFTPCLAILAAVFGALEVYWSGWFGFFSLNLALGSGEYVAFDPSLTLRTALEFWGRLVLLALPVPVILVVAAVITAFRGKELLSLRLYIFAAGAGMLFTSWAVMQVGGYRNDMLPAYAGIATLFALGIHDLLGRSRPGSLSRSAMHAACIVQFVFLLYPLRAQLPSDSDLRAGQALIRRLRAQVGEVYVPFHPELALMAGKTPYASWSPMFQLEGNYGGGDIRLAGRVKTEFARAMERRHFSMLVLDQDLRWIWGDPGMFYAQSGHTVFEDKDVFWPVTGWKTRPEFIMLPISSTG